MKHTALFILMMTASFSVLGAEMRCGAGMDMNDKKTVMDMSSGQHDMDMQGGDAPDDARDPHAFADGYTLAPDRQLKLADESYFGMFMFNRLERLDTDENTTAYNVHAWYGRDYDKLVFMSEGDVVDGELEDATSGVYWGHAVATYWDTQLGVRHDTLQQDRNWLAAGVQGLAPYWFELRALAYLGNNGRTALSFEAEYELLFTQRLILQPAIEINAYGKSDAANNLGSGISDITTGLRLRYEFTRQFAPYIGIENFKMLGNTADMAKANNEPESDTRWVAGVRFWF
jgi:copper resistance protein B